MFVSYGKKNIPRKKTMKDDKCRRIKECLYFGNYSFPNKKFPVNYEKLEADTDEMIPPLPLTRFYVRDFGNIFDDADHGLMKYTFTVTCVFIFSAVLTEVFLSLQNCRRMKQQNDAAVQRNILDESSGAVELNLFRKQFEKKVTEAIDNLFSEEWMNVKETPRLLKS